MAHKKQSEKTYKILETEGSHTVASKKTMGAIRALEFENGTNTLIGPVELVEVALKAPKRYEDFSTMGQLVIDMAERIVPMVSDYLTEKARSSFECWLQNRKEQNSHNKEAAKESVFTRMTKAQQILESQQTRSAANEPIKKSEPKTPFTEFDTAYEEYMINMTSEEVQKELVDIFMLSVIRAEKIFKVSHANIVDAQISEREYIEGKVLIDKLCNSEVLDSINALLQDKPGLLEEWEAIALADILGQKLTKGGKYIPIADDVLKVALTMNK